MSDTCDRRAAFVQAWVFPALYTAKAERFYAYAAIYGIPALVEFGDFSSFSVPLWLLCAGHMQVHLPFVH